MIQNEQDKKLVQNYKQTNNALRKQLNALNEQIDRLLVKKSNKIGLQKLPSVSKKITNISVLQQQVDTLRKRLQILQKQNQAIKEKASTNYHQKVRELLYILSERQTQQIELKRAIKDFQRRDKIANVQNEFKLVDPNRVDKRIQAYQEEITRYQKMERQLIRDIQGQAAVEDRNISQLKQLTVRKSRVKAESPKKPQEVKKEEDKKKDKKSPKKKQITEEDWKNLKREFLIFKQSKHNEQTILNEENEQLRRELTDIQRKIKEKKTRISRIQGSVQRINERARVHSTLDPHKEKKPYRYRDRHNSIQFNTKQ